MDSRASLEARGVDGRTDLLARRLDIANSLLGRLEVARRSTGHGLDDAVEAVDKRVKAVPSQRRILYGKTSIPMKVKGMTHLSLSQTLRQVAWSPDRQAL